MSSLPIWLPFPFYFPDKIVAKSQLNFSVASLQIQFSLYDLRQKVLSRNKRLVLK
jgi:hypothetical protein